MNFLNNATLNLERCLLIKGGQVTKLQRQQNGHLTVPLKQPGTQIEDGDPSPRTNSQTLVFDMTAADSDDDDIPPDLTSNSSYEDWRANLDDCCVNEDSDADSSCDLTSHKLDNNSILAKLLLKFKNDPNPPSWHSYLLSKHESQDGGKLFQGQEERKRGKTFPGQGYVQGGADPSLVVGGYGLISGNGRAFIFADPLNT
jgi:hypothetical protein